MKKTPRALFLNLRNFCFYRNYINNHRPGIFRDAAVTKVFYDHSCVICRTEMAKIRSQDRNNRLSLIDISDPTFDADAWCVPAGDLNEALHVLTAEGIWLAGVPAIVHVYTQIGWGWLVFPARITPIARVLEQLYRQFARHRHTFSRWLSSEQRFSDCREGTCNLREGTQPNPSTPNATSPKGGRHE